MNSGRLNNCLYIVSICVCMLFLCTCCSRRYRELTAEEAAALTYSPEQTGQDWEISSPEAEGIDSSYIARLYGNAADLESIYGLVVVKNGKLIAEDYFHGSSRSKSELVNSVTKSYTGALMGIAVDKNIISSIDVRMLDFFPELSPQVRDPRKHKITIAHLLQMRAGFPWEESSPELFELLYAGFHHSTLLKVPLVREPGTKFEYSNLSSHIIAIILTKASGKDLLEFADEHLNSKIGIHVGRWSKIWGGYRPGHAELYITAREMARFGQLYLDRGRYKGEQIIPSKWIEDSFERYSSDAWKYRVGPNFNDIGYGYVWWAVRSGSYEYHLAWGHGGQQIAIIDDLNMVIALTADHLLGRHGSDAWRLEKNNLNLVADFIASLPEDSEQELNI